LARVFVSCGLWQLWFCELTICVGTGVGEFRERISLLSSAYLRRFF
jgi:uncharacterized membrane protein